jgi:DNA-binding response OmpR family regulator
METTTSGRDPWDGILEWGMLDSGADPVASVLVVDDSETVARLLEWELCMAGYEVELASDGKTALRAARDRTPDVVLTDVIMPEMDGFEVVRRLRADPKTAETAVIFVTARGLSADRMEGLALGADDYIVKPFDGPDLLARVAKVLQRARAARDESPLSGLPGHSRIRGELDGRIQREEPFALLVSDVAGLKDYNARYGFARGDRVLQMTARVLREVARQVAGPSAVVVHMGADDFGVLTSPDHAVALAKAIVAGFDAQAAQLYDPEDADRGYIQLVSGEGMIRRVPIVTIAVGVADTTSRRFYHSAEVLTAAADLAREAKTETGSAWRASEPRPEPKAREAEPPKSKGRPTGQRRGGPVERGASS